MRVSVVALRRAVAIAPQRANFCKILTIQDWKGCWNHRAMWCRYHGTAAPRDCWQCGHSIKECEVLCSKEGCGAVQKVNQDDISFFDLFGLKSSFEIDEKELENRFKALQKQLHPDKFARASEDERSASTQTSAVANQAFSTLRDPQLRAEYMLWLLHKQKVCESETARTDKSLMMEMFEWREKVDEAKGNDELLESTIKQVREQLQLCRSTISSIIVDPQMTPAAVVWITRMKYFTKMMEELSHETEH